MDNCGGAVLLFERTARRGAFGTAAVIARTRTRNPVVAAGREDGSARPDPRRMRLERGQLAESLMETHQDGTSHALGLTAGLRLKMNSDRPGPGAGCLGARLGENVKRRRRGCWDSVVTTPVPCRSHERTARGCESWTWAAVRPATPHPWRRWARWLGAQESASACRADPLSWSAWAVACSWQTRTSNPKAAWAPNQDSSKIETISLSSSEIFR